MVKFGKVVVCGIVAAALIAGATSGVKAEIVQLDLTSALNYDSVGEVGEKQYATWFRTHDPLTGAVRAITASTAYDIFKGVSINQSIGQYENNGRTFISQAQSDASGVANKVGLPGDYMVSTSYGAFEIGKGMTTAAGYTRYGITSWADPGAYPVGPGTTAGPEITRQTIYANRNSQTITLTGAQQGKYSDFNLLFNGWRPAAASTYTTRIEAL
jgi:hypothetical protein